MFLLFAAAAQLRAADPAQDVYDLFAMLASRLSDSNVPGFMDGFDKSMPGYESFLANITGLCNQSDVQSSLEFVTNDGTDTVRNVSIDWILQTRDKYDTGIVTRRRETVKCRVEKVGRHWKVFRLDPQSLFTPPKVTR